MPKIVQVAVAAQGPEKFEDGTRDKSQEVVVTALCEDGSVWMIRPDQHMARWERLPQIPQT